MSARNRVSYSMAIGLAAGVIVLITGMRLVTSSTSVNGVTISPRGSVLERDANSGTVLFYITNAEPSLVHLGHLELQVTSSNGWKTITEEWSPMLNPSGASSGQWAGTLLAGSHRTCSVQPPLQGPWRVRLTYLREERGVYALLARTRFALARRSLFQWGGGNVFRMTDQHQVVSQAFSQ